MSVSGVNSILILSSLFLFQRQATASSKRVLPNKHWGGLFTLGPAEQGLAEEQLSSGCERLSYPSNPGTC